MTASLKIAAVLTALFSATGVCAAHSAGFDCAKAASRVEKTICADSGLSALDERLTAAFKAALAAISPAAREALRLEQRTWLKTRDACPDAACLARVMTARAEGLERRAMDAPAPSDPSRPQSLAWLAGFAGKSTNDVCWDARFRGLPEGIAPEARLDLGTGGPAPLAAVVTEFLCGPPEPVRIDAAGRIVLSGCRAHSCPEKAWLWLDPASGQSLGALIHYVYGPETAENGAFLLLFATTAEAANLPKPATEALRSWLAAVKPEVGPILASRFLGPNGVARAIPEP